jgi:hypothetical protein
MADTSIPLKSVVLLSLPSATPGPPFTIIDRFLRSPASTAEDTVVEILRPLNDSSCLQEPWNSPYNTRNYIAGIFGEVFHIATQLPCEHPWHHRLAKLVKALGKQPPPPRAVCVDYGDADFSWAWHPNFGSQHAESWSYQTRLRENAGYDTWSPQEWLSMNNFLAVLVAEDFGRLEKQFAGSGLKVLVYTLENPRSTVTLENNISSAAIWILTAGNWLREHQGPDLDLRFRGLATDFKGPIGLTDERWQLWGQKFQELAGRSDLSAEAREWASRAADYISGSQ